MADESLERDLIERALASRELAYAPYSGFKVGAAALTTDGRLFSGANVENASYGLSMCAERVAISNGISHGATRFSVVAIAAHPASTPCGACRQVLYEASEDMLVLLVDAESGKLVDRLALRSLLPNPFRLDSPD